MTNYFIVRNNYCNIVIHTIQRIKHKSEATEIIVQLRCIFNNRKSIKKKKSFRIVRKVIINVQQFIVSNLGKYSHNLRNSRSRNIFICFNTGGYAPPKV